VRMLKPSQPVFPGSNVVTSNGLWACKELQDSSTITVTGWSFVQSRSGLATLSHLRSAVMDYLVATNLSQHAGRRTTWSRNLGLGGRTTSLA
jgi:hypothetical protein